MRPESGVSSLGSGSSVLRLSADEKSATVTFTYSNLTTPVTSTHIHGPADPGQSGGVLFDLDGTPVQADGSFLWTFTQVGTVTPAQIVQALKTGRIYINVHSSRYPSGEIRGHYGVVNGTQTFVPPPAPPALSTAKPTATEAARFLTQSTFGPKMADITALQNKDYDTWLYEQFALPLTSHLAYLDGLKQTEPNRTPSEDATIESFWKQAVLGNDQLRQRVSFALNEIFVVSFISGLQSQYYAVASYTDMLNRDAFANFRQLLEDVTRMKDRFGSLRKHFEQANGDLDQLNVSTDKISKRALKIESMDLADAPVIAEPDNIRRLATG